MTRHTLDDGEQARVLTLCASQDTRVRPRLAASTAPPTSWGRGAWAAAAMVTPPVRWSTDLGGDTRVDMCVDMSGGWLT